MIEKKVLENILQEALTTGGDFAEIFEEKTYRTTISMLNGKVEHANSGICSGIGLRIYHGLESVYAYTNNTKEEHILQMTRNLASSIGKSGMSVSIHLTKVEYENRHPIREYPNECPIDKKVALMKEASDSAAGFDEVIKNVLVSYMDEQQHVAISNSNGRYIEDTRVHTRLRVKAIAQDAKAMETGSCSPGASMGMEFYEEHTPCDIGREAARIAKVMLHADPCPSGIMPVIIENGFGGVIFHEACGHSLEAHGVAKKQSNFADKLGQQIASTCVSAVDDGTIVNAWGSANIDDEGNFTRRNVLIEHGILKSYLVDTLNGRRLGMDTTASARKQSYKFEPTSRMTNTFIENGTDTFDEMVQGISYGLYAKRMGGGSVETTGDFNFAVLEAYLIEQGKITKPVKGATLIGNGSDTLRKIDRVSDNLQCGQGMCGASSGSIPTDVGQPAIRVSEMIVGGSDGGNK